MKIPPSRAIIQKHTGGLNFMENTTKYNPSEEIKNAMSLSNMQVLFDYEDGKLDEIQCLLLFSELLKSGLVWQLQGHYGRTAKSLIEGGFLEFDGTIIESIYE